MQAAIEAKVEVLEAETLRDAEQVTIRVSSSRATPIVRIRSILREKLPEWAPVVVNSSEWLLTLRPSEAGRLRQQVLNQTLEVIGKKVDGLGIAEATAQFVGLCLSET